MVHDRVAREEKLGRLVELGCGTGFYTEVLARKADTLLATDVSPGMLELARRRVNIPRVTFKTEDCQHIVTGRSPEHTVAEIHRILRPEGTLIMVNRDPHALNGLDRLRSLMRIFYRGVSGYRVNPPKAFGRNVITEQRLRELLGRSGFRVESTETIRDPSRSSNVPVEYVRAVRA